MTLSSPFAGMHDCGSCQRQHGAAYETWCPAERRRLHPSNFERWTETEHAGKRVLLTWSQQVNVWAHMDAGEAWANGELTTGQYQYLVAGMEPLPSPSELLAAWSVLRAGRYRGSRFDRDAEAERKRLDGRDAEAFAMSIVSPVTPKRLTEVREQLGMGEHIAGGAQAAGIEPVSELAAESAPGRE